MLTNSRDVIGGKVRKALAQWSYLPRTLKLVWQATRGWTVAWAALLAVQGLLPVAVVYLTRPLVDGILAAAGSHGDPALVRHALFPAIAMAAVLLVMEVLRSLSVWVRTAQSELLQDHVRELIHRKSVEADLGFYDSADYHDHLHRARADGYYRSAALLEGMGNLVQNGLTLVAMAGVLSSFGVWLPLSLVASTLPALYVVLRHNLLLHEWRMAHTADERRANYYGWVLTAADNAAELRLFGLGDYFRRAYSDLRARLRGEAIQLARRQSLGELGAGVLALGVTAGALTWVFSQAIRGVITLGVLALFYQAFQQGLRLARTLLENVGQLYVNTLFLENLFAFLALKPKVTDPPRPRPRATRPRAGITFSGVTFRYPGSDRTALENFDLSVPAGRMAAIVGPNGSGKSTLVKLLCRFYDPEQGRIELDGIDVREFSLDDLRRQMAVLFQEPVHYNDTVTDNIWFGDVSSPPDLAAIRAAAQAAEADEIIAGLPQGYGSLLGKLFASGSGLSVGEWQRVGLARAFLRRAPILILDEPTSAMDPWAEAEWLGRLRGVGAGRTTILITHRLTTAMRADVIHVVSSGRVVESGSHHELLARGGLYARSRTAEMENELSR